MTTCTVVRSDAPAGQQQVPAANQGASAAYYKALERESWERYCRAQRDAMSMRNPWPW